MDAMARIYREAKENALGRRCLVVDDDTKIMHLVADMLAELGYQVDMAENGSKALQKIRVRPYDMVLSDLEMPLVNGFLLASRIKSHSSDIRTMLMTGRCHAEVPGLMTPAVVDAWLFKPFNLDELCRVLEDLWESRSFRSVAV